VYDGLLAPGSMTKVLPRVYLGNFLNAEDPALLLEHGVGLLFTVCSQSPRRHYRRMVRMHMPLLDGPGNEVADFYFAVATVHWLLMAEEPPTMLIHCRGGISRSPAVLATAMASYGACTFDAAMNDIAKLRPSVDPHPALRKLGRQYLGEA
jgi:atypical dual specificity phosphatase